MILAYKIVLEGGIGETVEKKSRFIATVLPVENEEDASTFIERIKKQYWDATHNCFAYVIGNNNEIQRCSDDGEPSGTAGKPMLDVLLGEEIHNAVVVVTRYFGGTLLGTGGLVRAYAKAVQLGLSSSTVVYKNPGRKLHIRTDYNGVGKLQYIIGQMQLNTLDILYTDEVNIFIIAPMDMVNTFCNKVTEATAGKAEIEQMEEVFYTEVSGEVILL
jgi:uncharacterized protein, YigZ family